MSAAPLTTAERLAALARPDKWYLSCGDGVLWAPSFPVWLHVPGFWDEAHVDYHPVAPLFAVALVDASGRAVPLSRTGWRWQPDRIDADWATADGRTLHEVRAALPGGRFVSAWHGPARDGESLVAFSVQPGEDTHAVARRGASGVTWARRTADRRGGQADITVTLTGDGRGVAVPAGYQGPRDAAVRVAALRSEGTVAQPIWLHTPFAERWTPAGLREEVRLEGLSARGFVHLAVAVPFGGEATFALRLTAPWHVAPIGEGLATGAPAEATAAWSAFLERFPRFTCSDPYLSRFYDYRLYGLRLNRLAPTTGHVRFPCIAEGIAYFHVPITYSAQCHMFEMRWAAEPDEAFGSLRNFLGTQKADGGFHGRLYSTHLEGTDFYHANWGDAVQAALDLHPDDAFAREACAGLARYAQWLLDTRDREGSGLFDVVDQFETGQEYMSRYLAVDPQADAYGWENRIRLKGIDISVYAYQLFGWLARTATALGDETDAARWQQARARTGEAIVTRCWDEGAGLFMDVAPGTLARTGVKAAVGFYPLLTDLVTHAQLARMLALLNDPGTFGTPWPLPSSSVDDPLFNPLAEWKGKRHVCPWNGRAWPMTTSHVIEGLLRQWQRGRREAGPVAADLLTRYVRMFFDRGDLARPTCYEHYNPLTGEAAFYRGIDDYMHSWVADLLIRGVAGLEPTADGLRIDPLPCRLGEVRLDALRVRGHRVSVALQDDAVVVTVDGHAHAGRVGTPLEIAW